MTSSQRSRCNEIIHSTALKATAAGTAGGLFGALGSVATDATILSGLEVMMIINLGKVFNKEITESVATGILGALAGTAVGKTLAGAVFSNIPIIGGVANGAAAATTVEAIGWAAANAFDNGTY